MRRQLQQLLCLLLFFALTPLGHTQNEKLLAMMEQMADRYYEINAGELDSLLATHDWSEEPEIEVRIYHGDTSVKEEALYGKDDSWDCLPAYGEMRAYCWQDGKVLDIYDAILPDIDPESPENAYALLPKISLANPKAKRAFALLPKLGAEDYRVRGAVRKELRAIGLPALGALLQAVKSSDPEIRVTAKEILPPFCEERLEGPIWEALLQASRAGAPDNALQVVAGLQPVIKDWKIARNIPYTLADMACYGGPEKAKAVWRIENARLRRQVAQIVADRMLHNKKDGGAILAGIVGMQEPGIRLRCWLALLRYDFLPEQPDLHDQDYTPLGKLLLHGVYGGGIHIPEAWRMQQRSGTTK